MTLYKKIIVISGDIQGVVKLSKLGNIEELALSTGSEYIKSGYIAVGQNNALLALVELKGINMTITTNADYSEPLFVALISASGSPRAYGATSGAADINPYMPYIDDAVAKARARAMNREDMQLSSLANAVASEIADSIDTTNNEVIDVEAITPIIESTLPPFADIFVADTSDDELFYNKVAVQIDELFNIYPHDYELEELVHGSRWARVDYDDNSYYVVGIIYEDDMPQFICYGAPVDIMDGGEKIYAGCEWLPLDRNNPHNRGYWVLYQSALSGELMAG